jgi:DtxR family Mn-dependent transcriptional regulator
MTHSESEENYLKAVFMLSTADGQPVSTGAIAQYLSVQAASVTEKLNRMATKGLIDYRKSRGAVLTETGRSTALQIIRKHRLWELFLTEKLGFKWDEVHDLAEQLEHIASEQLISRLDQSLGFPTADPHGDPIPDARGHMPATGGNMLSYAEVNNTYEIISVRDSSAVFLRYLDKLNIALGQQLYVQQIEDFDGSVEFKTADGRTLVLSREAASNLMVKKAN